MAFVVLTPVREPRPYGKGPYGTDAYGTHRYGLIEFACTLSVEFGAGATIEEAGGTVWDGGATIWDDGATIWDPAGPGVTATVGESVDGELMVIALEREWRALAPCAPGTWEIAA